MLCMLTRNNDSHSHIFTHWSFIVRVWHAFLSLTSCRRAAATICPRPCTPHAAAQLQPIHALPLRRPACLVPWIFLIDKQRLALGGSVEYVVVHINYVVTWTANQSGLVIKPFDLENGVRVTCDVGYLCANFSLPGLSVLDSGPTYATDRQPSDSIIA